MPAKIAAPVLTRYLSSGKRMLLSRVLDNRHGLRVLSSASFRIAGLMFLVTLVLKTDPARSEDQPPPKVDKGGYTLFNPVPDDQLRDFSTDRPGKSHSSTTVDAGHYQIESDFLNYTFDSPAPGRTTRAYSIGTPIIKAGVTNWMDLEIATALFSGLSQSGGGATISARGFGDTAVGAKINVFGNDGGDQSLALLPFVKFPTAARNLGNDHVEFALFASYTVALSKPWSLTLEPNFGILRNNENMGDRQNYGFIANLNRPVFVDNLTAAIEVAVDVSSERRTKTRVSLDPSLQYLITKTLQLDVGIYIGLNKATPQAFSYTGISFRF